MFIPQPHNLFLLSSPSVPTVHVPLCTPTHVSIDETPTSYVRTDNTPYPMVMAILLTSFITRVIPNPPPPLGSKHNRTLIITNPVIQNIPVILSNCQPPKNNHVQRNLNNIIQVSIKAISPNHPTRVCVKKFVLPKMLLLNARSLLPKLDELRALLSVNTVDMVVVTETWFSDAFDDCFASINGYNLFRIKGSSKWSGRWCLYIFIRDF